MNLAHLLDESAETALNGAIGSTDSSLVVAASAALTPPFRIWIGSEMILVRDRSGNTYSSLIRGIDNTTAAAHADTDRVIFPHVPAAGNTPWAGAIFELLWRGTGGGSTSPLTTKGDLWGYSTVDARVPIGSDGQVLVADSAETIGVKWSTASGFSPWEYLGTVSLSGGTTEITSLGSSSHKLLKVVIVDATFDTDNVSIYLKFKTGGGVQSSAYRYARFRINNIPSTGAMGSGASTASQIELGDAIGDDSNESFCADVQIFAPHGATWKRLISHATYSTFEGRIHDDVGAGNWEGTDDLTGLQFSPSSGNFAGGDVYVWGLKAS